MQTAFVFRKMSLVAQLLSLTKFDLAFLLLKYKQAVSVSEALKLNNKAKTKYLYYL